jgi:hypothetical protein
MSGRHRSVKADTFVGIGQPPGTSQRLALWAMSIAAAIEADALVVAAIALLDMTTKCSCSAQLDCTHDATLRS